MIREGEGEKRLIAVAAVQIGAQLLWESWILDHHDLSGIYLFHLMTGPRGNSQPTLAILGTTDRDACYFETLSPLWVAWVYVRIRYDRREPFVPLRSSESSLAPLQLPGRVI